jgi:hypothetical protein
VVVVAAAVVEVGMANNNRRKKTTIQTLKSYKNKMVLHIDGIPLWNENVYVGRSKQRGEKWGLFANHRISASKDKWIIEFKGDLIRAENFSEIIQKRGYYVLFSRDTVDAQLHDGIRSPIVIINVDPFVDKPNYLIDRIGGFAVHAYSSTTNAIAHQDYNLPTTTTSPSSDLNFFKIYLYPTRTIKKNEEIVWEYAKTYFCDSSFL